MANTKIPSELIADNSVGIDALNVTDGTNGQYLQTDGAGTLSFSTVSGYTDSDVATYLGGGNTINIDTQGTIKLDGNYPTGTNNVALGDTAGQSLQSGGNENTFIGDGAGASVTTGIRNVIIGYLAGDALTDADENIAVGKSALSLDTLGTRTTAIGKSALSNQNFTSSTDTYNVAVGYEALKANITGVQNTALGGLTLDANTIGSNNTALGYASLTTNTASNNTAVGHKALQFNNTGQNNVALGTSAGDSISTGSNNTVIGSFAGVTGVALTTGGQNVLIGRHCHTSTSSTIYANGIGYNIEALGGYTTVGESGSDIRAQHGVATWTTISDERVKKDIQDSTVGLSFINDLRPVTFNYKHKGDLPTEFRGYEEGSTEVFKSEKSQHGFIAQEVKAAIDKHSDIKDGFSMWDADDETGQQRVGETALIPMLVKAIQELSEEVETLKSQIGV